MSGVNKVIILGRLGKDVELRYTQSGSPIATLSIATSESWKDKQSGEKVEKTEWHKAVCFGPRAEVMGKYLQKGSQVYIEGKLQTDKWQDKETGADRYSTSINVQNFEFVGATAEPQATPAPKPKPAPAPQAQAEAMGGDPFSDDIPFAAVGKDRMF